MAEGALALEKQFVIPDYERKMLEYFKQMINMIWCGYHKYHS